MEISTPLPEYVRIRDIAKRWNVEVPYIMQFQKEVNFLYGGLPETLTPYNPDEILREVANEAREKGDDPLMAKLKFAENEIPKLEASMLWLHRDDVLRIERTHIITENLTLTERQGNKKGAARQDSAAAFGGFLAQLGQAAIWLKVVEREAEKALQDSPTANRLLKRYAELTGQTKGKCEPMQSRYLLTDQVVTAQAEPKATDGQINQESRSHEEADSASAANAANRFVEDVIQEMEKSKVKVTVTTIWAELGKRNGSSIIEDSQPDGFLCNVGEPNFHKLTKGAVKGVLQRRRERQRNA